MFMESKYHNFYIEYDLRIFRPLYKIRQELLHFLPHYNIVAAGTNQNVAVLKKKFTFMKPKCEVESIYGNYELKGDLWAHDFSITKNGQLVATISKRFFSFSDTYGVEILGSENHPFILTMVIVIESIFV